MAEKGSSAGDGVAQLKEKLQATYSECTNIIDDAAKIDHAYDYACRQNSPNGQSSSTGDSAPCRLFYYWFGHKYWVHLNRKTLSEVLKVIYDTLGSSFDGKKCDFKYEITDQTLFKDMKIIFDFYHDYKNVPILLNTTSVSCADGWSDYWETLSSACQKMKENCKEDGGADKDKPYCTDFNSTYAIHCDTANLHQEMEVLIKKMQREADEAQTAASKAKEEAVRGATTTSSISSIFGTLTATAFPFLLYKYKPWSSLFGNHSSGNGGRIRKKRSAEHEFDTLTEASATTDSILDSATVVDSTTLRSGAYNARQSSGRRNNNTPGHHRNNIGYSRT